MFSGLIAHRGRVAALDDASGGRRLVVEAPEAIAEGVALGDSIAVDGCCLTVVELGDGWWAADAVAETMSRTTLGDLRPGDTVDLERPVRLADRLGGHLVQGHVDGVGTIRRAAPDLEVEAAAELLRYLVPKGSITVDGTSLTVVAVHEGHFTVAIIPHTAEATVLGRKGPGDRVNLEVDVMAKYAERLLAARLGTGPA